MARNQLAVAARPEAVWDVLADPACYGEWVVGSEAVRTWDGAWPAPGTRLHHRVAGGIEDDTTVLEAEPPRRLLLRARARPLGTARVELWIEPHPAGALVTMVEDPESTLARVALAPVVDPLTRLRNGEALRRLRGLAERRAARRQTPSPPWADIA